MSSLKLKKIQLGKSLTPGLNFTIMTPDVPDGTLEIRRGVEAEPGALVLKVGADGVLVSSGNPAERQNGLLNWIYQSKLLAAYRRGISLFADGFKATDGVNTGASSNYTVDTSGGKIAPTIAAGTTVTNTGTVGSSQTFTGDTEVDRTSTSKLISGVLVGKIGVYSSAARTMAVKVVKLNTTTNFDIVYSEAFAHPGGGWVDKTLTTPFTVPGTGDYYPAVYTNGPLESFSAKDRSYVVGDTAVSTGVTFTDAGSSVVPCIRHTYGVVPNNATVVTSTQTIPSSTKARALLEYNPVDVTTLNTDLTVELSCNGGTDYTLATLTAAGVGQSNRLVAETNEVTCTSGTSLVVRTKTLNNKNVQIYGLAATASA